jgi:hypothetical protein
MKTLKELASDELIQKYNELTDPLQIRVADSVLEKDFSTLTYLDSTFLRDIFRVDLNNLIMYFKLNEI